MADTVRYINTNAGVGGNGTTNNTGGAAGSRAYQSLAIALAAEDGVDHSSADNLIFMCDEGGGGGSDTSNVTTINSSNWPNPPIGSIIIMGNDGSQAHSYTSEDQSAGPTYSSSKYEKGTNGAWDYNLELNSAACGIEIKNIQLATNHNNATMLRTGSVPANEIHVVDSCLLRHVSGTGSRYAIWSQASTNAAASSLAIINNVMYGGSGYGIFMNGFSATAKNFLIANNTIVDHDTYGIQIYSGIISASGDLQIYNNLLYGNSPTEDYEADSEGDAVTDNNLSKDATSPDTAHRSKTVTFDDASGGDYQTSDADVVGLGTDMSSNGIYNFDYDMLGVTRSTWDIGAFQSAAGGVSIPVFMNNYHQQGIS